MTNKFLLMGGAALLTMPGAASANAGDPIPNSYICTFVPGPISTGSEARSSAAAVSGKVTHIYSHVLSGFSAHMSATAVQKMMAKNPLIRNCTQDRLASIPPTIVGTVTARGTPPLGGSSAQTVPWGVKRVGGPGNSSGTAWIIDTGIDLTHPDLNVSTTDNISFLDGDTSPNDANGHGTHVAGIIAARNNTIGVVGVAAGARVVSVRVLDASGNGADSGVIAALDYVVSKNRPGDVINLSLITSALPELDQAVAGAAQAGYYVAIAAGNEAANAASYSPARVNGAGIYTVSATDSKDVYARYSNWGNPPIDFTEPGSSVLSTYKGGAYATLSGTSMAAPHLAGILLLHGGGAPVFGRYRIA